MATKKAAGKQPNGGGTVGAPKTALDVKNAMEKDCVETVKGKRCGKPAPTHGLCPKHLKQRMSKEEKKAPPPKPPKPTVVRRPFKHILPVPCSDQQLVRAGKELAKAHSDIDHIAAVLSEAKKKANADIEPLKTKTVELLKVLDTGARDMPIKCERVVDFKKKETSFIRKDTGETFHTRPLNPDEEQREFSFFSPEFDITY